MSDKTPRKLLAVLRESGHDAALCDLLEQLIPPEAQELANEQIEHDDAIRADERERIAQLFETGAFPIGGPESRAFLAKLIRESGP